MWISKQLRFGFLIVLLSSGFGQAAYEKDRDCPVVDPRCHCSDREVDCSNGGFTTIPPFKSPGSGYLFKHLKLGGNFITSLGPNAFVNINVSEIWLENNNIRYIDNEAFVRLENTLTYLDLSNNNLNQTPFAISKLNNLTSLYLHGNPITANKFTTEVMRSVGDYISEFSFGDPTLSEWPSTLHHLQGMKKLKFLGGSMTQINRTAFHGFEWMLQELWIQNTQLISVPIALQDLKSVREFHFDNNIRVADAGILIPAFAGFTSTLETLSLENNSLTTIPSVLLTLPNLQNLSLARNLLQFISDQAITNVVSNLTTLNLQSCGLDRIPGALSRLPHLLHLDFSHNQITSIEKNDLQSLYFLQTLDVSDNKLLYVSKSTFHDLRHIQQMYMRNNEIYLVPEALQNIPSLHLLDVSREPDPYIECNCDLSWLYCHMGNSNRHLRIVGECYTITMAIQDYTLNQIPTTCPISCAKWNQ